MKKWLVIILLVSGLSRLEATSAFKGVKRVHRLPPLVVLQRESTTKNIGLFPVSPAPTETVDVNEESLESLDVSTASSQSSTLSIKKAPAVVVPERKRVFIPYIIWQGNGVSSTEKDFYLEKKHENACRVDYKEGEELKFFSYLERFAQEIERAYGKEVEDIYFGVPIDPVIPITSYSVRRYRTIFCMQDFYFKETLENLIEYCEKHGPLHIILSSD